MRAPSGRSAIAAAVVTFVALGGCTARPPRTPSPGGPPTRAETALRAEVGLASYYGRGFHGRRTASGRRFDMRAPVAAHPEYPFGTRVRVTNLTNQRQVVLTIIDRGPSAGNQSEGVVIDVSQGAAERLAFIRAGRVRVRVEVLEWGRGNRR